MDNNVQSILKTENTPPSPPSEARVFTLYETLFAWFSLLAGYLFCRAYPAVQKPMGNFLFITLLFCVTAVVMALNNAKFGKLSFIFGASAFAFGVTLLLTQNYLINLFVSFYCIFAYGMFVYTAYGNHSPKSISRFFPVEFFKALFVIPLKSFGKLWKGLLYNGRINARPLLKILAGICLTVIPTAVIMLLLSYDNGFRDILNDIFDFDMGKIFSHIGSFILGIIPGSYIFGAFLSSADKLGAKLDYEKKSEKASVKFRFIPVLTAFTALLPILAVYVIFFISQWKYYVSGFIGVLPDELVYSSYARQGFFQLCTVSVINMIIITVIGVCVKRANGKPSLVEKILSVILSVFTLVLIATAVAKMVMYIDIYGLTPKRVYATWFMLVLALLFVLTAVKQFVNKLPLVFVSVWVVTVMLAVLAFAQTDKLIAEYNVNRYFDGTIEAEDLDTGSLIELGDAAIPSLVRVVRHWDETYGFDHKEYYENEYEDTGNWEYPTERNMYIYLCRALKKYAEERESSFWSFTLLKNDADKALAELGLH